MQSWPDQQAATKYPAPGTRESILLSGSTINFRSESCSLAQRLKIRVEQKIIQIWLISSIFEKNRKIW
jgi:hypothetical protein